MQAKVTNYSQRGCLYYIKTTLNDTKSPGSRMTASGVILFNNACRAQVRAYGHGTAVIGLP